ncbi:MAG TPA: chorismate synthase, partial [Spirochaetota bacterium]|nr:chorismate synthase [Spirochaetota bacterium]
MNIAIVGAKSSGKSTIGKKLSERLKTRFIDTDKLIEELYRVETGVEETFREIYRRIGEEEFRSLEERAINSLSDENYSVISLGGSAFLNPNNRRVVRKNSIIIFLDAKKEELWKRITRNGVPVYLDKSLDPKEDFFNRIDRNREVSIPFADILIDATVNDIESIVDNVLSELEIEWSIRMNAPNTLGEIVRISTFGESHGKALGVVLDGVSPGIPFDENIVQKGLDRRKPGQSKVTTQRTEDDKVKILSGVFEGKTTGTPIA